MRSMLRNREAGGHGVACLFFLLAALLPVVATAACRREPPKRYMVEFHDVHLHGETMGTSWNVTVSRVPPAFDSGPLEKEIQLVLDRVDGRMSTWNPESELARFNAAPAGRFGVSRETENVVREAMRTWARTDGAFDPTIMPLVDLWGFGPAGRAVDPPSDEAIAEARKRTGVKQLHTEGKMLRKEIDGLQLDLSAIAKGYGVDAVCVRLKELGHRNALVEVGGELRTMGNADGDRAWRIGIDRPTAMGPGMDPGAGFGMGSPLGESLQAIFEVGERAIATSGDYRNWREVDGVRISHTIDPRTGRPVNNTVASATVLAPTCMEADALATALMVLGPEQGLKLIESLAGVEASLILRDDGLYLVKSSSSFPAPVE